ncbi:hypothetical protein ACQ264_002237 [Listeria monocytogenes]
MKTANQSWSPLVMLLIKEKLLKKNEREQRANEQNFTKAEHGKNADTTSYLKSRFVKGA